ncbi:MAG: hypothetical protein ACOH1T_06555 [Microbacteriaceae bacterium]
MRGMQLVIEPEGIGIISADTSLYMPEHEIVLAGRSPDGKWDITLQNGNGAIIDPRDWRGGQKWIDPFMERLPERVRYERRT